MDANSNENDNNAYNNAYKQGYNAVFSTGTIYASGYHNSLVDGHNAPLVSNNDCNKSNNNYDASNTNNSNDSDSAYNMDDGENNNIYKW